ncbi:MAG: CHAP domain-containing protein [Candidatus Berkelbacteria bacterium]|nr:CHAP domain-containing protein [Candidatus Berkelbacteria bacterium]
MKNQKSKIKDQNDKLKIKKFGIAILVVAVLMSSTNYALALTNQQKLQQAQQQQAAAQAAANQKAAEAAQMKQQIAVVDNQINETQSALSTTVGQISTTQSNIDNLTTQIAAEEKNLADEKDKMNKVITSWYMDGSSGFLEAMISSSSISALIERQQYYDSIKTQINSSITKINSLKDQLSAQKTDQQKKMADLQSLQQQQTAYKTSVEYQKSVKTNLLSMTLSQQQTYLAQVAKLQSDISQISAAIYAERQKSHYNESLIYGSTSYPFGDIDEPDPWSFLTRECTSYAAWYWNVKLGKRWTNTQPGRGSARYWPEIARTLGYSVSSTPRVGAIVSWYGPLYSGDQWGHVAIVEAVNGDGTIDVSEYNWTKYSYDYRKNVNPGNYGSYSYIY